MSCPLSWTCVAGSVEVMIMATSSPVALAERPDAAGQAAKPAAVRTARTCRLIFQRRARVRSWTHANP